jgi:hypothetical protein
MSQGFFGSRRHEAALITTANAPAGTALDRLEHDTRRRLVDRAD